MVLGGGPDHRRTADVDLLDHLGVLGAAPCRRALERVQVHADQVDERDVLPLGGAEMHGVVAYGQQPAIELGVKRLDTTVHDLRKAREILDRAN